MDTEGQLSLRQRPASRVVMRQSWERLLFLHWEVNPDLIAATLPDRLIPDCYEGKAYLGIVPFFMKGVRPVPFPALPWLSNFLECNLRTYVVGPDGPGVWFYSLDCNQPVAVEAARNFFHLSYFHASMDAKVDNETDQVTYQSLRKDSASERKQEETSRFVYEPIGSPSPAQSGSLEFFLLERYLLYSASFSRGRLYSGRVWHEPYQFTDAKVSEYDENCIDVAGFNKMKRPPDHQCYSPGVDVSIFSLQKVRAN